ncbi:type II 3-dehydroquinate dehydratase [Marinilabiliaceae bacterium ANBcel2]|nr:type II 3-dehydroquinate dehydratase [Marinilabiliaceae bacterium ANBcel2]
MRVLILNGPNLNLLELREPDLYGGRSFDQYLMELETFFEGRVNISYYQSNSEGGLIDYLHNNMDRFDGVVINAAAYTHTSIAISDAVRLLSVPVIEVHISNIYKREEYRHHSFLSPVVEGVICGFGLDSYRLAIEALFNRV